MIKLLGYTIVTYDGERTFLFKALSSSTYIISRLNVSPNEIAETPYWKLLISFEIGI